MSLVHKIALTLLDGVGDVTAKILLGYCGSAEAVFNTPKNTLLKIPSIGEKTASNIISPKDTIFREAEREIQFIEKEKINVLFLGDEEYPQRLKHCNDAPILLYYKGNAKLNTAKVINIVGTRNATEYGKLFCKTLIQELAPYNILVVSGLAYGIDVAAHRECIANNVPTIGVLAHGLDKIYPAQHSNIADKMLQNGGLLTEYRQGTTPERENFPSRNRIVAGMSDATIVVEAAKSGGALITAEIANSYNRDVFALPGRITDEYSAGCNELIKNNKAAVITSAKDLVYLLGWETDPQKKPQQRSLAIDLSPDEQIVYNALSNQESLHIDQLNYLCNLPQSKLTTALLQLEMHGIVSALPGSRYKL